MAAIHPQQCNEIKVNIIEKKHKKKRSKQRSNQLLLVKLFETILFYVFLYIFQSEIVSSGLEIIINVPKDAILYRYQMLGASMMIGTGCFSFLYIFVSFFKWLDKPDIEILNRIKYYCTREDKSASMAWYQGKWFAKAFVVICIGVIWVALFRIAHILYIADKFSEGKLELIRTIIYCSLGMVYFAFWLIVFFLSSFWIIVSCIIP